MKRCVTMLLILAAVLSGCSAATAKTTGTGYYFDTVVTLTLYGAPEGMMEQLWQACARYEQLLSRTLPGSDVDRINRAGGESVTVDAETWQLLQCARELSAATDGAFSVTIAPLSALWDFTGDAPRIPAEAALQAAIPLVDDSCIRLGEGNTVTLPAGMQIDLGGIAKGYIADRLAEMLRGQVSGAILNFGGNVYVLGTKPDGSAFRVGVADPDDAASSAAILTVQDTSVVTSGTYQRCFTLDGESYHHILDPQTGHPARTGIRSATIVAESSMTADALATACIVLGTEKALTLLQTLGLPGMLILEDGRILMTEGMAEEYSVQLPG